MLYTRFFEGSCVSEHRILISIDGLSLWSVDILHQSYLEMLNALGMTQQHNGYTEIIGIYKPSREQFNRMVSEPGFDPGTYGPKENTKPLSIDHRYL